MRVEDIRWGAARCPEGSFATLLIGLPPQCYAAFGTTPHTLASMVQILAYLSRTSPPPLRGRLWLDFGGKSSIICSCTTHHDNEIKEKWMN